MNHKEILNQVRAENNTEKIEWCYLPADEIYEAMKRAAKQAWINGYNQGIIEESGDTGFSFDDYMLRIAEPTQIAQKNEFVIPAVSGRSELCCMCHGTTTLNRINDRYICCACNRPLM